MPFFALFFFGTWSFPVERRSFAVARAGSLYGWVWRDGRDELGVSKFGAAVLVTRRRGLRLGLGFWSSVPAMPT